jgi:pyruvate/2-oxoglutarate/acetoin dehydrogenase E1 component
VIDLISLKPFDMETISNSIKKTRHAIIVEECMKTGGIGASLSAIINESLFDELDHQVTPLSLVRLVGMHSGIQHSGIVAAAVRSYDDVIPLSASQN